MNARNNLSAFEIHEDLVDFLDSLAVLSGCKVRIGYELPDGLRPDVMRIDTTHDVLFIGDAKNTESPGCSATKSRLKEYIRWLAVQIKWRRGTGLFAICHARFTDGAGWERTVLQLARHEGLILASSKIEIFEPTNRVQLFIFDRTSEW